MCKWPASNARKKNEKPIFFSRVWHAGGGCSSHASVSPVSLSSKLMWSLYGLYPPGPAASVLNLLMPRVLLVSVLENYTQNTLMIVPLL